MSKQYKKNANDRLELMPLKYGLILELIVNQKAIENIMLNITNGLLIARKLLMLSSYPRKAKIKDELRRLWMDDISRMKENVWNRKTQNI